MREAPVLIAWRCWRCCHVRLTSAVSPRCPRCGSLRTPPISVAVLGVVVGAELLMVALLAALVLARACAGPIGP